MSACGSPIRPTFRHRHCFQRGSPLELAPAPLGSPLVHGADSSITTLWSKPPENAFVSPHLTESAAVGGLRGSRYPRRSFDSRSAAAERVFSVLQKVKRTCLAPSPGSL